MDTPNEILDDLLQIVEAVGSAFHNLGFDPFFIPFAFLESQQLVISFNHSQKDCFHFRN